MQFSSRQEGDWTIITMPERINGETMSRLDSDLASVLARPAPPRLLFDLGEVRYIDSTGIGGLLSTYTKVKQQQGRLGLIRVRDNVQKILTLVKLQKFIRSFASAEEAMAALA